MRGRTLGQILNDLRAEIGHSVNVAHGVAMEPALLATIRRQQEYLWWEHDWPHMLVWRVVEFPPGERYMNVPDDLNYERLLPSSGSTFYGDRWIPIDFGIDPVDLFGTYNSDLGEGTVPIQRWDVSEDTMDTAGFVDDRGVIEVWPVPPVTAKIRIRGVRALRPLVDKADTCDIDSNLIVLFSAAEFLARQKAPDAEAKAAEAQRMLTKIKSRGMKLKVSSLKSAGWDRPTGFIPQGPPEPTNRNG